MSDQETRAAFEEAIDKLWPNVLFDWQLFEGEYVNEAEKDFWAVWQASARETREEDARKLPKDADRYAYNLREMYKRKTPLTRMEWAVIMSAASVLQNCADAAERIRAGGR